MNQFTYKTIIEKTTTEIVEKKSKFIAIAFQTIHPSDFIKNLKDIKSNHPKAVHHCYAYRLGFDKFDFRCNDDGEPSGSAGKPILGQIDSKQLTNIGVVVVRYFGGILLGVSGLVKAYKNVTRHVLENAPIISLRKQITHKINFSFTELDFIMNWIKKNNLVVLSKSIDIECTIEVSLPVEFEKDLLFSLTEKFSISNYQK